MYCCDMSIEKMYDEYDKILQKLRILQKKRNKWGLSEKDLLEANYLFLRSTQYKYQITDTLFAKYVEPLLYNEKIIEIKTDLECSLSWDGDLYFFDNELDKMMSKINKDNFENVLEKLKNIRDLEIIEAGNVEDDLVDNFRQAAGIVEKDYSIEDYVNARYLILEKLIRGEMNE